MSSFRFPHPFKDCKCPLCTRIGAKEEDKKDVPVFEAYKLVKVEAGNVRRNLTEKELQEFEDNNPKHSEWSLPQKERSWHKLCSSIIDSLMKHPRSLWFRKPVNFVELNIADYPKVIKHPMDLGTVKKRLKEFAYTHPEQFVSDTRLVFRNAYLYNPANSAVWVEAEFMSKMFEEKIAKERMVQI